ncbi:MAG TPA: hypothetical protein VNK95_03745, partial [Caldilineaceae bacterium]|nr:hypothetical protein [Caldilineaceae bacterium]
PALRAELLTAMSERPGYLWRGHILQIFLAEGMLDRALALLGREPSLHELEMVMPQAIEQQPAEMMRLCLRSAEQQVRLAKAAAYEEAIGYLTHARAAAERAGLMDEWAAFVARLREAHARKRTFISLLNRLG